MKLFLILKIDYVMNDIVNAKVNKFNNDLL